MTHLSPRAIEAATQRIYEDKGDRKGVNYIGWEFEPEEVKAQWREDVSVSVVAYLTALEAEGMVVVPKSTLYEIANRASNMLDPDAAEWMPSIYKIACEAVGEDPTRLLQAAQGGDDGQN